MAMAFTGISSLLTGGAGAAGALGSSTLGKAALGGLGAAAGKGIFNVLTGNGPIRRRRERERQAAAGKPGGCSCSEKPQYSCEEKCQYGRMMAEKCMGCRGYSGKAPGGYRRSYGSSYGKPYKTPAKYNYKGGYKGRPRGRQARLAWRDFKKTSKHPRMQARKDIGGPKWGRRR